MIDSFAAARCSTGLHGDWCRGKRCTVQREIGRTARRILGQMTRKELDEALSDMVNGPEELEPWFFDFVDPEPFGALTEPEEHLSSIDEILEDLAAGRRRREIEQLFRRLAEVDCVRNQIADRLDSLGAWSD